MSEIKRGALQSPADTARTTDTIVRHTQLVGPDGNPMPSGSDSSSTIAVRKHISALIDEGLLFRQAYKYDIADEGIAYMLMKVGTKYPHMRLNGQADGDVTIEIYHTPTVTLDGVEEPSGNFNFNSGNTSLTTWFPVPTIGDDGSYIANTWVLGGSGVANPPGATAAGSMSELDVVLIPTVEFLIKFINTSGREIQMVFEAIYEERTDG